MEKKHQISISKSTKVIPTIINGVTLIKHNKYSGHRLGNNSQQKSDHRILIIGDSHARGLARHLQMNLSDNFRTEGIVKPGARISTLITSGTGDINELTDKDIIIFCGGAKDIGNNNTSDGLKHIIKFVQTNKHTNIMLLGAPFRYDLPKWSCVNDEVQTFNRKLMKLVKPFDHVRVLKLDKEREFFTRHGQHLNDRGKERVAAQVVQMMTTVLHKQNTEPISLHWNNELEDEKIQVLSEGTISINSPKKSSDKEVAISSVIIQGDLTEEVKEISEKWIQSRSTEKLEHQAVKAVRSSKRLKKTTIATKNFDFLGEKERV